MVADEVRNLASKSAEAASTTTSLIGNSITAVDKGKKSADATGQSLQNIFTMVKKTNDLVEQISAASEQQTMAINQVKQGMEQISAVVQTNSATSEESAAASEELNSQAQDLKNVVAKFKLR